MTFGTFGHAKVRDKNSYFKHLAGEQCSPLQDKVGVQQTAKRKNQMLFSLFLLHIQAQKKKVLENFNFGSDKILIERYQR